MHLPSNIPVHNVASRRKIPMRSPQGKEEEYIFYEEKEEEYCLLIQSITKACFLGFIIDTLRTEPINTETVVVSLKFLTFSTVYLYKPKIMTDMFFPPIRVLTVLHHANTKDRCLSSRAKDL
jgi:hypothetical protein